MARLDLVPSEPADPRLASIFARAKAIGVPLLNLYRTLGHSPEMMEAWIGMSWPLRNQATTPRGLRELIIMRIAQITGAKYEWVHHWGQATANGMSEDKLRELDAWRESPLFSEDERAVLAYAEGIEDLSVSDEIFRSVRDRFNEAEILELTLTATFYCNVARVLQALDIDVEPQFQHLVTTMGPEVER